MSMGQSHLFLIENLTRIHLGFQTHVILLTSLISVAKFDLADQRGGGQILFTIYYSDCYFTRLNLKKTGPL